MIKRNKQKDLKKLAIAFFENLEIDECEFGGIGVNCKRPFGNSYVEGDILEIIGWEPEGDDGEDSCFSSEQKRYARDLYLSELIPYLQTIGRKMAK
jgi:hypothetical protein